MSAQETTTASFQKDVLDVKDTPVLVDFWAPWCGPCLQQGPIIDAFADEMGSKIKIYKLNVDDHGDLAAKYSVMSIPSLIIFKNGEVVAEMVGVHTKQQLKEAVEKQM